MRLPLALLVLSPERREREQRRAEQGDATARTYGRTVLRALFGWIVWYSAGTAVVLYSFSVDVEDLGRVFFWLGVSVGNVGALLHVMFVAVRGTERGDL